MARDSCPIAISNCNIDSSLHHILILPCVDRARRGIDIGVRGMCAVCARRSEKGGRIEAGRARGPTSSARARAAA